MDDPRQAPDVEAIVESIDGASDGDLSAVGPALADPTTGVTDGARPPETISRLADDLLPALIARLDASGLGELEVRTNAWRIRLRKPYDRRRTMPLPEGRRRRGGVFEPGQTGHAQTHGVGHDEPRSVGSAGAPAAQGIGSVATPTARSVRGDRRPEGRIGGGRADGAGEARGAGAGVGVDVRRDLDTGDDLPTGI
ncbi:MAG TPA: hypothetical protein VN800_05775, partial [Candidatus Acidoferrales bacterium]|nr:hypothetical protein [Candidatus Acidoferrales bacterium]